MEGSREGVSWKVRLERELYFILLGTLALREEHSGTKALKDSA